ncbi:hypothetical protein A3K70_01755 [Candidatus Bathyarchaeota archaeon RBG_16_48_13]|nr:MAG: hypothetical protein A3K70_01755 [Candidatus Bathyarchaeota archaeon RBG_16_48_13]
MKIVERFEAQGHVNVAATHPTTIEITRSSHLTKRGDCVVAVGSTKGAKGLSDEFKRAARSAEAKVTLTLDLGDESFSVSGSGSPWLTFLDPNDMVFRKSTFVSDRTVMVLADWASIDIPRGFVRNLKDSAAYVSVRLSVEV